MTGHPSLLHALLVGIGVEGSIALIAFGAWLARCKSTMKGDTE